MKPLATKSALLSLLLLLASAPVQAQTPGTWSDAIQRLRGTSPAGAKTRSKAAIARLFGSRSIRPRPAALTSAIALESEPNDSPATADSVALGDQATGVINPVGDQDIWFVDLTAGQFLSLDVDAQSIGSLLDPVLSLLAPDGRLVLKFNDDFDGFDSRITFRIPASGRYYVVIRGFGNQGSPALNYSIKVGTITCAAVGTEREPNDGPATASPFAIGDTASGEICPHDDNPAGDVDYWAFTAQGGTTLELDVDAATLGVLSDPFLAVFASDGITRLAANDDADGPDSRLQVSITTTGTYYAAVSTLIDPGGNPFPYRLHARVIPPGPGDPTVVRADHLGLPLGLAAGSAGDLFVGDVGGNRVLRVAPGGTVTTFLSEIPTPTGLAFDAFDRLLVVSLGQAVVYRVSPDGRATRFITDAKIPFWIAVAPDGRIWLTDIGDRSLRRYSPTGQFETSFDLTGIGGTGPGPLAIGPTGDAYVSNGTEIWRLINGVLPRRILTSRFIVWGFAFDVAGNIYAPNPAAGQLQLFDGIGRLLSDPFALGADSPFAVAFGRDQAGTTLPRLFVTDHEVGALLEVNPAAITNPGLPLGHRPPAFTLEAAAAGLLGGGSLRAEDLELLDALGNRNGRYDLGDFQAFLRSVGDPPAPASSRVQERKGSDR